MIIIDRRERGARWLSALDHAPEGMVARVLGPLGAVYAGLSAGHRVLRRDAPLPVTPPSIAIGNLRVGGTGKTPVVNDIGRRLVSMGKRVAVLSRGYRAGTGGDEPAWLEQAGLHVFLGPDRHRSFGKAARRGADVVLLDDGLQTRAAAGRRLGIVLQRDLERPPRTLPAGPAREGAQAALARTDVILVRREGAGAEEPLPSSIEGRPCVGFRLVPRLWVGPTGEGSTDLPEELRRGRVLAVSGLARPESFEDTVGATGVELAGAWRGRDHWDPTDAEVAEIDRWARQLETVAIVTPEKNLARLIERRPEKPVYALAVEVQWDVSDPLGALGVTALLHATKGDTFVPPSG